ncbi:MAG: GWxTD domain-containing protein [Thermoanaerobaculia bacterium]
MRRMLIACATMAIVAGSAFAQLSPEYREWAKGPAQFIMTPQELTQWNQIKTDADAKAFTDLFWARRDPSPGTPANEYRDAFEAAVKYADDHFDEGRRKGPLTDRGRILVLLGPPSRIERTGGSPAVSTMPGGAEQPIPTQIWVYDAGKSPVLGQQAMRVAFADQFLNNTWSIQRGTGTDIADLTRRSLQATVVNPNLTEVPKPQTVAVPQPAVEHQTVAVTTPARAGAGIGAFKTDALKTAVEQFKSAKTNPYKSARLTYTELLSPAGEYFVPVQLYIPKSAGLTADQVTTFFGALEDSAGNAVAIFEEPATLSISNGDLYFDRSLTNLKPGSYRATLGLSDKDARPVVMVTQPIELKPLSKDETAVSRLVVSSDVHQTEVAALAGAPYAFGRVKIVPKGDHVFTNKDEITYFVEVINPGLEEVTVDTGTVQTKATQASPTTSTSISTQMKQTMLMPKLQVKLELVGTGTKDKPGKTISAPISDAAALPLTGAPGVGQYAIMAGIPLGEMKTPLPAGEYTLRVKVYDQVKKQSWTVEQPMKLIVGTPAPATNTPPK